MKKATELLRKSKIFYLATTDGGQPRVRPFGAVAQIDGKVYICTNNQKDVYRQMMDNPNVEISGMLGDSEWFRLRGTVKRDGSLASKEEFLRQCPLPYYKATDEIFELFYFTSGRIKISSFTAESEFSDV